MPITESRPVLWIEAVLTRELLPGHERRVGRGGRQRERRDHTVVGPIPRCCDPPQSEVAFTGKLPCGLPQERRRRILLRSERRVRVLRHQLAVPISSALG